MNDQQAPRGRWAAPTVLVVLYVGTFVVLAIPAMFLATGIQAIGRTQGWWVGDSNANDGEEVFATAIGGSGTLVVLALATVIGFLMSRGLGASTRGTAWGLAVGTAAVLSGHVLLARYLLTPP